MLVWSSSALLLMFFVTVRDYERIVSNAHMRSLARQYIKQSLTKRIIA